MNCCIELRQIVQKLYVHLLNVFINEAHLIFSNCFYTCTVLVCSKSARANLFKGVVKPKTLFYIFKRVYAM